MHFIQTCPLCLEGAFIAIATTTSTSKNHPSEEVHVQLQSQKDRTDLPGGRRWCLPHRFKFRIISDRSNPYHLHVFEASDCGTVQRLKWGATSTDPTAQRVRSKDRWWSGAAVIGVWWREATSSDTYCLPFWWSTDVYSIWSDVLSSVGFFWLFVFHACPIKFCTVCCVVSILLFNISHVM